jgi:hypothetical protein
MKTEPSQTGEQEASAPPQPVPAEPPKPVPGELVIQALWAMDAEARKRGEMFPQTADEQREDTEAVRRVIASLEFYTSARQSRNGWPGVKDWPALPNATPLVQPAQPIQGDQALSQGDVSGPCV